MKYRGFEIIRETTTNRVADMSVESESDSIFFGGRRLEITQPTSGSYFAKHVIDVFVSVGAWPDFATDPPAPARRDEDPKLPCCGTCTRATFAPDAYVGACGRGFTIWRDEFSCASHAPPESTTERKKQKCRPI